MRRFSFLAIAIVIAVMITAAACSSDGDSADENGRPSEPPPTRAGDGSGAPETAVPTVANDGPDDADATGTTSTFTAEVWADNWFSLSVNGEVVGVDSVPITTERSFNAETFSFEATYPLTITIEAKDFKETDSGIEYIGLPNQQMGDGGLIAQITDNSTGEVIAVTNAGWTSLVIHRAPLNKDCERSPNPDAACEFEITDAPADWTSAGFDDGAWGAATEWTAADVGPKDGYEEISWNASARLIWGADLEVDNTVLFRLTVAE